MSCCLEGKTWRQALGWVWMGMGELGVRWLVGLPFAFCVWFLRCFLLWGGCSDFEVVGFTTIGLCLDGLVWSIMSGGFALG